MFATRYFPPRYFAPRFFPPAVGTPSDFVCDLQIAVPSTGVAKAAVGNPSVVFPVPANRLQAAVGTPRVRFPATSTPSVQIVGGG
jgi:hypothetical protein